MSAFEEEDDSWIPLEDGGEVVNESLVERRKGEAPRVAYSMGNEKSSGSAIGDTISKDRKAKGQPQGQPLPKKETQDGRSEKHPSLEKDSSNRRLQLLQRKLEDRISIQQNLVDHPIDYFWRRCLVNFLRQIWTLEMRIRLGIVLLTIGILIRLFVWCTWYLLYPRFAVLTTILVGSLVYLDPFDVQDQLKFLWDFVSVIFMPSSSSPQKLLMMENFDTRQLRRLSFVLLMIPTMLEIRTFSFLSRIGSEVRRVESTSSDGIWRFEICYFVGATLVIFIWVIFLLKVRRMKACDVSHRGLLVLYGFSLLFALYSLKESTSNIRKIPFLAAPFLTASATILLTYQDHGMEWISRIVRHTFRLSLKDVLSLVSERVTEDEMLQLAILRWICDFWASDPSHSSNQPMNNSKMESTSKDPRDQEVQTNLQPGESQGIRWEELQPMLNVEIDHMQMEIDTLQQGNDGSSASKDLTPATKRSSSSTSLSSKSDTVTSKNEMVRREFAVDSLVGLKSMLLSFDVDERAEPAVVAYKKAIASIPPKKKTAVSTSITRRCPAFLTVVLHVFFVSEFSSIVLSTIILSPFLVIEYYRIVDWIGACHRFAPTTSHDPTDDGAQEHDWRIPQGLRNLDAMTILLSEDDFNSFRPPSLLLVWRNIQSSVSALEMGLSTARCAETTAVAIEFAGSAMSLLKFGFEVSQNGIFHGAMILVKEVLAVQATGRDITKLDVTDRRSAEYTSAAITAVTSGQRVVKNVHRLSQDQHVKNATQPILQVIGLLAGHGWLWGKEGNNLNSSETNDPLLDVGSQDPDQHGKRIEILEEVSSDNTMPAACESEYANDNHTPGEPELQEEGSDDFDREQDGEDINVGSRVPDAELSHVMDMVAMCYEQGLIDDNEKDDFFQKLVGLDDKEIFDSCVVSGMKRTLEVLLENGTLASNANISVSSDAIKTSTQSNIHAEQLLQTTKERTISAKEESNLAGLGSSVTEPVKDAVIPGDNQPIVEETKHQNNLFTIGAAALGVVASGVVVAIGMNAQDSNEEQHSQKVREPRNQGDQPLKSSSQIDVFDSNDERNDGEWIAIS